MMIFPALVQSIIMVSAYVYVQKFWDGLYLVLFIARATVSRSVDKIVRVCTVTQLSVMLQGEVAYLGYHYTQSR